MAKTSYPLASVYGLLEPGPVVLLTTLRSGAPSGAATDPMAQEVFDRVRADRTVAGT